MRRARVLLVLLAFPGAAGGQSVIGVRDSLSVQVDRIFGAFDRTDTPGCAVGVYSDGRIVYARGYGMANLELGIPITPRTVFNTGSVSKIFTAIAIVLLAQDGKLSLEDPIRRFFPEMPPYADEITIRHLLTHTAGLHEYYNLMRLAGISSNLGSASEYARMLTRSTATNFPPGARSEYSNSAYVMAGEIVSRVSGQSLAMFLKERVFDPLGMADTRHFDEERLLIPGRSQGYDVPSGQQTRTSHSDVDYAGDGGVWSNIEDFARWDRNWESGTVGGRALSDTLIVPARLRDGSTTNAALGGAFEVYRGLRSYTKDGSDLGHTATYRRFLDQNVSVVTLCNLDANTDLLTRQVSAVYLGAEMTPVAPLTAQAWETALLAAPVVRVPAAQLRRLEGWWRDGVRDRVMLIRGAGDSLDIDGGPHLVPLGGDRFRFAGPSAVEANFDAAVAGTPRRLRIRSRNGAFVWERMELARPTTAQLAEYAGQFHCEEIETTYTLIPDSVGLAVRIGGRQVGTLVPTWRDGFSLRTDVVPLSVLPRIPGSQLRDKAYFVEFNRDARGRIVGFVIQGRDGTGVRNLPFARSP